MKLGKPNQKWFEMKDVRKRKLDGSVWIPLRAFIENSKGGEYGYEGYISELYGLGTLAVPIEAREAANNLGWSQIGAGTYQGGYFNGETYISSEKHSLRGGEFYGTHLLLAQAGNDEEQEEWHLSQDFVITLGLKREQDSWVALNEGYKEVARLKRSISDTPTLLEVRASYLKDYLCAREMALIASIYRERVSIVKDASSIAWSKDTLIIDKEDERWEGRKVAIHEGGHPFGQEIAVHRVSRTDVDSEVDVPELGFPTEDGTTSETWTRQFSGRKLYRIAGALWKTEWVEPGKTSPLVRGDEVPSTIYFITNAEGKKESAYTLVETSRWLWFQPDVIPALAHRRGGALWWFTRDTAGVRCSPGYQVHFGVNSIGLISVFAKDIALLPEWQQKIWAGHNVSPEGKVSPELLASQMEAQPANTMAPEEYIPNGITQIAKLTKEKLGVSIVQDHAKTDEIMAKTHRFRSTDQAGLLSLAKDIARLTADSLDATALRNLVKLTNPKDKKLGSLKLLERLFGKKIASDKARKVMGPLFGIYDLRLADAHLPTDDLDQALKLVGVDQSKPFVIQGFQMLDSCAKVISEIIEILRSWDV